MATTSVSAFSSKINSTQLSHMAAAEAALRFGIYWLNMQLVQRPSTSSTDRWRRSYRIAETSFALEAWPAFASRRLAVHIGRSSVSSASGLIADARHFQPPPHDSRDLLRACSRPEPDDCDQVSTATLAVARAIGAAKSRGFVTVVAAAAAAAPEACADRWACRCARHATTLREAVAATATCGLARWNTTSVAGPWHPTSDLDASDYAESWPRQQRHRLAVASWRVWTDYHLYSGGVYHRPVRSEADAIQFMASGLVIAAVDTPEHPLNASLAPVWLLDGGLDLGIPAGRWGEPGGRVLVPAGSLTDLLVLEGVRSAVA